MNELSYDLKQIKSKYGEAMMHLSKKIFSPILEENSLFELLSEHFDYSKDLCKDIIDNDKISDFKNYVYSYYEMNKKKENKTTLEELCLKNGYDLYECKSESDIQKFKKYYTKGEEPFIFNGNRLRNYDVFFAVKKNADNIKREDFEKKDKQDLYGNSVLCIQFWKNEPLSNVSIKNRYNRKVTYSSLDTIFPGLTKAFEEKYKSCLANSYKRQFEMPCYVKAKDGRFYKYNYRINKIYYCANNVIIDDLNVIKYDKERYIVFDYFILDTKNKTLRLYDTSLNDSFIDETKKFQSVKIEKSNDSKRIILDNAVIGLDKNNNIISYSNAFLTEVEDDFLLRDETLRNLSLPSLKKVGSNFMLYNSALKVLNLPNLREVGNNFLRYDESLEKVNLPSLEKTLSNFLQYNTSLTSLQLLHLQSTEENFLYKNSVISDADFPSLRYIDHDFMHSTVNAKNVNLELLDKSCYKYLNEYLRKFVKKDDLKVKVLNLFNKNVK